MGKNLIIDSYLLKGFFIYPELFELMQNFELEQTVKIFFELEHNNSLEKIEFNNN